MHGDQPSGRSGALLVHTQSALGGDTLVEDRPSRRVFVIIWVLLHGALLLAIIISFWWLFPPPLLLVVSYALVMRWYRPAAGSWGGGVCWGGAIWMAVASLVQADDLVALVLFGLITGLTTLSLLPWRGWRTATWPLINLLGTSAAAWVFPAFDGWGPSGSAIVGCFMAGALYGLITGPALAFFLRDDPPAPGAIEVQDDQPTPSSP